MASTSLEMYLSEIIKIKKKKIGMFFLHKITSEALQSQVHLQSGKGKKEIKIITAFLKWVCLRGD